MENSHRDLSLGSVHESVDTTRPRKGWRKVLAFMGPAYMVSVGYMDPGNWATDLQGGARFGYQLIWVLLMSNLMALLLQSLSARLGIVSRRDLAQANREVYPAPVNFCLYLLAELAIAATDLAEVLGMAIGIHLLTGLSLLGGVGITVLDTFLLFLLQRSGMRRLEAFIVVLIATIGISFLIELILARPHLASVAKGFIPTRLNKESLYIAVGIIGATVMPHNLYLHSALVQTRKIGRDAQSVRKALKYNFADSVIALNAAFLVNAGILVLAAAAFFSTGNTHVAKIEDAHRLLEPLLGPIAPVAFAVALIAAGQSSTVTGTLAGQIVMEGYLQLRINPLIRRLITRLLAIAPAVIVIAVYGDDKVDELLVFSQVLLSLQLGFAVIPLIHFVSDRERMGQFAISRVTRVLAWLTALVLVYLNVNLVADEVIKIFTTGTWPWKIIAVAAVLVFAWLFFSMALIPVWKKGRRRDARIHAEARPLSNLAIAPVRRIAVALDFTAGDEKLIAHALQQGGREVDYTLLHIVESPVARHSREKSDDYETRKDEQRLLVYQDQLKEMGYRVEVSLGFGRRKEEIVRIVQDTQAGLLVMGAHRHHVVADMVFGETIEAVRHRLTIPLLVVNV